VRHLCDVHRHAPGICDANALCSCSCERAVLVRSDVERKVGIPLEEAVKIWVPRWKREF